MNTSKRLDVGTCDKNQFTRGRHRLEWVGVRIEASVAVAQRCAIVSG
jgi:hypothetical protein